MSCCSPPPFQKRQAQQQTKHQFVFDIHLYCENVNCETNSELQDINSAFRLSFLYFEFTSRNSSFPPQKKKRNLLQPFISKPFSRNLNLSHDSDFICKKIQNCEIKSRKYLFFFFLFFYPVVETSFQTMLLQSLYAFIKITTFVFETLG